jgi:sporulation protein YlmC with PRC-barrel domain
MLKLSIDLFNRPIISLRTGGQIGVAIRPLINPNNLKIEGWFCTTVYEKGTHLLPTVEIREIAKQGIAVNDHESITHLDEFVRLKNIIAIDFQLIGKAVVAEPRKHLGKVDDYATDLDSFYIQRLYVAPQVTRLFTRDKITITRQQIVEITDKKIIVSDPTITVPAFFTAPAPATEG